MDSFSSVARREIDECSGGFAMNSERLDPKAVERISGEAWQSMRPLFDRLNDELLSVSPTVTGVLTTIYIKYASPETSAQPYAVVWVKKSTEIVVGLSLPSDFGADGLVEVPHGYKYAGLTKYLVLRKGAELPPSFGDWVRQAYSHISARKS